MPDYASGITHKINQEMQYLTGQILTLING